MQRNTSIQDDGTVLVGVGPGVWVAKEKAERNGPLRYAREKGSEEPFSRRSTAHVSAMLDTFLDDPAPDALGHGFPPANPMRASVTALISILRENDVGFRRKSGNTHERLSLRSRAAQGNEAGQGNGRESEFSKSHW